MYVTKHRGSACTDEIIPYSIDERGLHLDTRLAATTSGPARRFRTGWPATYGVP